MMRIVRTVAACFVLSLGALACGSDTAELEKRVDLANEKLDALLDYVEKAKGPPKPDPKTVYSVPLGDSPYVGEKHAKITIGQHLEIAVKF